MPIPETDQQYPKEHIHTFKFVFNQNPFSKNRVHNETFYSYILLSHNYLSFFGWGGGCGFTNLPI